MVSIAFDGKWKKCYCRILQYIIFTMLYSLSRVSLYQHIQKDLPLKELLNVDSNLSGAGVKKC